MRLEQDGPVLLTKLRQAHVTDPLRPSFNLTVPRASFILRAAPAARIIPLRWIGQRIG